MTDPESHEQFVRKHYRDMAGRGIARQNKE
jgi:hypothetical protein